MFFMAHMKLCTEISIHCVLGLGYPHLVTKVNTCSCSRASHCAAASEEESDPCLVRGLTEREGTIGLLEKTLLPIQSTG